MVNQQFKYPYYSTLYVRKVSNFPETMFNNLFFMTKFPSVMVTYLNLKGFSRLLNKTFDSELSFVSRQTMHQSHLRKSATCSSRNFFNSGVSLTPWEPEKQNEKLEVLTADDFNLRSIGSRWRRMSGKTQTSLLTIYVERTRSNISIPIKDMFLTVRMSMN